MQFEKVVKIDPSRDEGHGHEKVVRIEKGDSEYYRTYDVVEEIKKELGVKNEKSKSKVAKKKPAKNVTKSHKSTVESLQEKLQ